MLVKYTLAWIGLVFLAIFNAGVREILYQPLLGDHTAHQLSTLTVLILFGLFVWILSSKWRIVSAKQAVLIGLIWLCLTITFEFLFGHFVMKNPWSTLLYDYNLLAGRLWILVLIFTTVAPYLCYKLRTRTS
ncbi:MAG: hypothetical protein GQ544_09905 [Candidatus Aminicenantes bacterium]|nr:hypothetical protein [Candidatus Aminicenantes bacterium]